MGSKIKNGIVVLTILLIPLLAHSVKTGVFDILNLSTEQSTPSTPTQGVKIYPKSDNDLYFIGDGGTEENISRKTLQSIFAGDYEDTTPVATTWILPSSSFTVAITAGTWNFNFKCLLEVIGSGMTIGNQILVHWIISNSLTPGSGQIGEPYFNHHYAKSSTTFNHDTIDWTNDKEHVATGSEDIFVHIRYSNFSGTPTITNSGCRSNTDHSGSGTEPILTAIRVQ